MKERNPTRSVAIGSVTIGSRYPIAVQSMTATSTTNVEETTAQVIDLVDAGADVVRIAADSKADAAAIVEVSKRTSANIAVDLQENYRLAELVAPYVEKLRYNPGHLYHHEREKPWRQKVQYLLDVAGANNCAMRVGVNCGSVDPAKLLQYAKGDSTAAMVDSALEHCEELDRRGFHQFCVSLKDSDPGNVVAANKQFAKQRPDVPLHLGVTEAGLPPDGIIKTRIAFEQLISQGIGDTVRVSLTVPNSEKPLEIESALDILRDIKNGRVRSVVQFSTDTLNIISCPSCSRVENEAFIQLAQDIKKITAYAQRYALTIAVMGCRVNGPGETDEADLGLWCGPNYVNLKKGVKSLGQIPYDAIIPRLKSELDILIKNLESR
ncbi:MAG: flavodoxin-dependent (E)-4-hydroxy-3-methylbut-2-enyl-diphosphate synthase [Planctomycetaceae bacterium]|jgi:(E)-4-hydroxy-3-methylbut-2-enyl-diphosphate synthase|nr:flavodoxin-dependent (E)-4-hydroxy-3-methylbut-2-enyl-diphosphate synthase [Planctomycetaceae bacterium]MBT4725091.1 flavodoxin-dependent (E)-4-hydroxy-3-methylbut-2-enyl-diphosphate synthase [Planctomycetaceae bacterium]MBT5124057.1 flavodoxin-dependent (E)-4-hydroxy-3-methylbut-2-enyl-diphosphate synthase [Planctomycetaceae bacterium]MBT5597598.1 flavodoxin-dependent (E)-4-hydroxy-3-methylbut-2-enyl-diphosphate synthase [Planctomycetaceae bacterium]MBT5884804.1 flavodoxin-dependent (E)-4-h